MTTEHLPAAAALFTAGYRGQLAAVPQLSATHAQAETIEPLLRWLSGRAPGVAAFAGDRLIGYLIGMFIPGFKGSGRGAYVPEWGHALDAGIDRRVYNQLYAEAAKLWVAEGCFTHVITLLAEDKAAENVWYRSTFGLLAVDGVRPLTPAVPPNAAAAASAAGSVRPVTIRTASAPTEADLDLIAPLEAAHQGYMTQSPIFMPTLRPHDRAYWQEWLSKPGRAVLIAMDGDEAVGCFCVEMNGDNACHIVTDPATAAISGAFTSPTARATGVGTALLNASVTWALAQGAVRLSVDWEAHNPLADRFWTKHFTPVCHSLIRRVDDRINGSTTMIRSLPCDVG